MITDPRIGTELAGYRIETLIGRGGMSVVYLAEDVRLKRKVALKLLAPELGQSEKFQERFVRESQLAASIDHPNIIPIFGAGEVDGLLYIAMRYVEGTDLKTLIEREGPLAPDRAIRLLSQAGSALDTAHARGLIHRDVKSANILIASPTSIGGQEHVYLSDFGLTKRSSSDSGLTGTGQFVGTLDYAAPEQFQGKPLGPRTDVYSLGCVLYECLTSELPFHRDSEAALVYAHLMAAPPPVTDQRPDLGPAIDEVLARAMAKAPEQRYQTAGQLVDGAREALEPDGSTAVIDRAPSPPSKPGPPRRPVVLAGIAALVVVAVVVGLLLGRVGKGPAGEPSNSPTAIGLAASDRVTRISQAGSHANLARIAPVRAGSDPRAIAVSDGSIWVANEGDGTVSRIDPATNKSVVIKVGVQPDAIGAGEGGVWVVNRLSHSVSRIDPGTNKVVSTISLNAPGFPSTIAVGEGAVWVGVDGDYPLGAHLAALHKIDPQTNEDVAAIPFEGALVWVVVTTGDGSVWAAGNEGNLVRIDPRTNQVRRLASLAQSPAGIAMGDGSLWIATTAAQVLRVDPADGRIEATVPGGGSPAGVQGAGTDDGQIGVTFDSGIVWLTGKIDGTIDRIVANGNNALEPIQVGQTPTGVAVGYGSVWVTVDAARVIRRPGG